MRRDSKIPNSAAATEPAFMRMASVVRFTGLGRTTIYRMVDEQCFPQPVRLGPRAIAWRRADLERWSNERPSVNG
ncbi:helix-turn-helix transcriptional regulator [Rubrivivax gelatinosus]|uniref:AlpA family transcriptional regulator n=1 Tax=Rubrivivax gelatinosus TaxID=28068 RepID=A0A4R2MFX5_RUBGE|nr:AlpA family phage regulatory protein [Rubrivivax gelatinosus]MBK1687817.1 AlpA family transcriptional regulator [Rubrivivax gelatinosus]TCP03434.1 AlpA family transcriptional regulator [Rubrivivax gelatinosus]